MSHPIDNTAFERVVRGLHEGRSLRAACEEADVAPGDVLARVLRSRRCRERFEAASRTALALVEDALYAAALNGNVTAVTFYLCNRVPDRWRPTAALKPETNLPAADVTAADLLERYRRADEAAALPLSAG